MKKLGFVVFSLALAIGLLIGGQGVAKADYLLDFSGAQVVGIGNNGVITTSGSVATGTNIPINGMMFYTDPSAPQTYVVSSTSYKATEQVGMTTVLVNVGYLDFTLNKSTGVGSFSIEGTIPTLFSSSSDVLLLSGTFSGDANSSWTAVGKSIAVLATGTDQPGSAMATALGISSVGQFSLDAFFTGGSKGTGVTAAKYIVNSTDIQSSAVPVPPSALLFAPGLLGLVGIRKRFKG